MWCKTCEPWMSQDEQLTSPQIWSKFAAHLSVRELGVSPNLGVPIIMENQMEKKMEMKWNLGFM